MSAQVSAFAHPRNRQIEKHGRFEVEGAGDVDHLPDGRLGFISEVPQQTFPCLIYFAAATQRFEVRY